jgi:hypothetical protein
MRSAREPLHSSITPFSRTRTHTARRWLSLILIASNLLLLVAASLHYSAHAASATVTTLDDSGPGSLRQAIADAAPGDTISFAVAGTINLTTAELLIEKDLTISGPGAASLSISGGRTPTGGGVRVFNNTAHLTITGLTIRDGVSGAFARGGGIWNQATGVLEIANSVFASNLGYQGGAIYNDPGGSVAIRDTTFSSNAGGAPADGNGGTIYNDGPGGVVSISGSLFEFNTTHDNGSALYNLGSATIVNSTFAFNQAGLSTLTNAGGTLEINNATIANNVSNGRPGSGLAAGKKSSTTVQNSILASNFAQGGTKPNDNSQCDGPITSGGHNIVGFLGSCNWAAAASDQLGTDVAPINPLLGPLQNNGGATLTMLPLPGSPAIDAGDPAAPGSGGSACAPTDQRGSARPAFGQAAPTCDIGAAEVGATPPPQPTAPSLSASADSPSTLGQATTFTANGLDASYSYHWDFGDGSAADGNPVTHIYTATGVYTASVAASSGTASLSTTVQVIVNDLPPSPAPPSIGGFSPASAAPGTTVTISGAGLATASEVTFNGVPASSFAALDDATLTAVVPASALNGPIGVVTAGGAASSAPFTVLTTHQCSVAINVPALAGGQTYWVQLSARASGPLGASWALPRAQSSQLLLYAGNPFAGQANPLQRGPSGKPLAIQNSSNTAAFAVSAAGAAAGTYTVQFFNSGKAIEASAGTITFTSDGAPCPSAAAPPNLP